MIREFRDSGRSGFGGGRDRGHSRGFGGGRGGFNSGGGFNRRDRNSGPREMFNATCSKCSKDCQVPFKPTGNKPVLCSDCFSKDDSSSRSSGQSQGNSKQLDQINAKLDKILAILKELELDVEEADEDPQIDVASVEDAEEEF